MIVVVEPNCQGGEHAVVNAGLIQVVSKAFPGQYIAFIAEEGHLREVADLVEDSGKRAFRPCPISLPSRFGDDWTLFRAQFGLFRRILRGEVSSGEPPSLVLVTAAVTPTLFAADIALRCSPGLDVAVQLVLHGSLTEIVGWRSRNPLRRAVDMRSALQWLAPKRAQLLVLERSIETELARIAPWLGPKVRALPHPLLPAEGGKAIPAQLDRKTPVRIGFLGLATLGKGILEFLQIARAVRQCHGDAVEFHLLGRIGPGVPPVDQSALTTAAGQERLPRVEFIEKLGKLHFVCLPYQGEHYHLSASGVLIDAIAWQKPVFALHQPITESLFGSFGDVGWLCDDIDDMTTKINAVVAAPEGGTYRTQVANMRQARQARLPAALASDYRNILREWRPDIVTRLGGSSVPPVRTPETVDAP